MVENENGFDGCGAVRVGSENAVPCGRGRGMPEAVGDGLSEDLIHKSSTMSWIA